MTEAEFSILKMREPTEYSIVKSTGSIDNSVNTSVFFFCFRVLFFRFG